MTDTANNEEVPRVADPKRIPEKTSWERQVYRGPPRNRHERRSARKQGRKKR